MADGVAAGSPRSALDMMITAIVEAHDCIVVTDNAGVNIFNPCAAN